MPACAEEGVHENCRVLALNVAPLGSPLAEYVSASPSGSLPEIVKLSVEFEFTDLLPIAVRVGARFTLLTVMVMVVLAVRLPSETVSVTL